jgi:hypothetical protein
MDYFLSLEVTSPILCMVSKVVFTSLCSFSASDGILASFSFFYIYSSFIFIVLFPDFYGWGSFLGANCEALLFFLSAEVKSR